MPSRRMFGVCWSDGIGQCWSVRLILPRWNTDVKGLSPDLYLRSDCVIHTHKECELYWSYWHPFFGSARNLSDVCICHVAFFCCHHSRSFLELEKPSDFHCHGHENRCQVHRLKVLLPREGPQRGGEGGGEPFHQGPLSLFLPFQFFGLGFLSAVFLVWSFCCCCCCCWCWWFCIYLVDFLPLGFHSDA